jgi:hypothetical protein
MTAATGEGVAIYGQPAKQLYFDRPLNGLLRPFFESGLAVDGLEGTGVSAAGRAGAAHLGRAAGDPAGAGRAAPPVATRRGGIRMTTTLPSPHGCEASTTGPIAPEPPPT